MNPVLSIDANNPVLTILSINNGDNPAKLPLTFVRLNQAVPAWFAYDQNNDRVDEVDEQAALPLELLYLAYQSGKAEVRHPHSIPHYTKASAGKVSHIQSPPGVAQMGNAVLAYAAAHGHTTGAAPQAAGAGAGMGAGNSGGGGGPGTVMVAMGGGGGGAQLPQKSQAEMIMQLLNAMPTGVAAIPAGIEVEIEAPVQDEQDSISQLDRELAGLDEFLNDVRGHTGGNL
jgi:hypothetical protein